LDDGESSAADLTTAWKQLRDESYDERRSIDLQLIPDGKLHTYRVRLQDSPEYRGLIIELAIEPAGMPRPGDEMAIASIQLAKSSAE
jgi:hypothetical protein